MAKNEIPKYIKAWHDYIIAKPESHGEDIKKLKKLIDKLLNSKTVWYDGMDVERFLKFCKMLKHKEGRWVGQPFKPSLEQKYIIACVFGFKTYDKELKAEVRYFTELILFVARKWGKSTFISAIADYMLLLDHEYAAQVWTLATQKTQAAIVYNSAKELLKTSDILTPPGNPQKIWRTKRDRDNSEMILFPMTKSYMKPGSKNSQSQDGLNPSCFVIDELHAIKDRNTYDVFSSAQGARSQPLAVIISTFGYVREGIFDSVLERCKKVLSGKSRERIFPMIFRIDDDDDPEDFTKWIKANPGLPEARPTLNYLKREFQKTKEDPAQLPSFLTKHLNRASSASSIYFDLADVDKCIIDESEENYIDKYAVGGVDLAETTDLCCATAIIPINGRLHILQRYFIAAARLEKNSKTDKMAYETFTNTNALDPLNKELLKICDGGMVTKRDVTAWFVELAEKYKISFWKIGFDRWHGGDWADDMEQNHFPKEDKNGRGVIFPVAMGARTLSQPMRETRALFTDKIFAFDRHNGLLRWCTTNTAAQIDRNNNVVPDKAYSYGRIDGYMALLIAYVAFKKCADDFAIYQDFNTEALPIEDVAETETTDFE